MPNVGVPSRGCRTCKKRRVKCDETRPECGRCSRMGRVCGGYEHDQDLVIVINQTQQTIDRAAKRLLKKSRTSSVGSDGSGSGSDSSTHSQEDIPISQRPPPPKLQPIIQHASNTKESRILVFLLTNMSLSITAQDALQRYLTPTPESSSSSSSSSVLQNSLLALVFCASWKLGSDEKFRRRALFQYSNAIRDVEGNLRDSKLARGDQVLLSVKLLELFECLCSDDPSNHAWARHASGSVTLVRWRGKYNFTSPLARNLFHSVRMTMIMTCIHYSSPVPPYRDDIPWSTPILFPSDPASELIALAIRIADLKSSSREFFKGEENEGNENEEKEKETQHPPLPSKPTLPTLLSHASHLDRALISWQESLPPVWDPWILTIPSENPPPKQKPQHRKIWKSHVHFFRNVWFATHSLLSDVLRIHVNAVVLRAMDVDGRGGEERRCVVERLQGLADRICACIAPGIEEVGGSDGLEGSMWGGEGRCCGGGAVYMKMWFLSTVARLETLGEEQRGWIRGRMRILAERFGMNMARHLSTWPTTLVGQGDDEPDGERQRRLFLREIMK